MELRYYINTTQISEPIGFDDFKTILKRTKQHGVSAESSVGELEFDGVGFGIIETAYNTDIDTELIFKAEIKCDDNDTVWSELYSGILDLSTYEETYNDYCGCKVKVGEIGVKTTFNNRVDTVVNVRSLETLDGDALGANSNLSLQVELPQKTIKYTSRLEATIDANTHFQINGNTTVQVSPRFHINTVGEWGSAIENKDSVLGSVYLFNNVIKTGQVIGTFSVDYNINLIVQRLSEDTDDGTLKARLKVGYNNNGSDIIVYTSSDYTIPFSAFPIITNLPINETDTINIVTASQIHESNVFVYVEFVKTLAVNLAEELDITLMTGSYINFQWDATGSTTSSKVLMAHETFSRLTEIISGLSVKSDYYSHSESGVGNGALKALTNNNGLVGVVTEFNISFKKLFENFHAIDNIGFGFSVEGNVLYLRVENWKWFYNSNVVLTIDAPANKTRALNLDRITSILNIGYNNYIDKKTIFTVDTINGNCSYSNKLKSIDNKIEAISNFISDPYFIELAKYKDSKGKDTDIFVLALKQNKTTGDISVDMGLDLITNNLYDYESYFNARISPRRNAVKFNDYISSPNILNYFIFTAGEGNFGGKSRPAKDTNYYYLNDTNDTSILYENGTISKATPYLKPELITFEHPLTRTQFEDIKADPYGQIIVDGEACYVDEIIREVMTGMCEFKLIPKN